MPTTKPRHTVTLTDEELAELAAARTPGTPEHEALAELAGVPQDSAASTAAALRALLALGRRALHERMAESSYAAEAAEPDPESIAARRVLRARLLARSDDEA